MTEEIKFCVMVSLFEWIQKSKQSAKKRAKLRKFLDTFCSPTDYFTPLRLILPSLDRERGTYGLKENHLATCLVDALGMSRESPDAVRLFNWRKGGASTGTNAGNFSLVAAEILQRRQVTSFGQLTIKELDELLDQLAACENRDEKTLIISGLVKKTNAQEMKWIIMIILKDLKLGMSEKVIFHEFHPDAEDLFNVTCDLKLVCEKLTDRTQRHKRQDIEVGKAVRPQLANRVGDLRSAWKKFHGKEIVVECKFDGDRIQVHKRGSEVHYFSRNFIDHLGYGPAMSDFIVKNVETERCILDGEMLVWDCSLNRFAEFGSNREIAKAVKDGLDSDKQICYVVFDLLYVGDTSVIHQSLKERQTLLQKFVRPEKNRLEILVPSSSFNTRRLLGEPCWSVYASTVDDVESFYKDTIENRDEGIIIKDLGSKWEPGDRSGKWLKLKPDYVHAGTDLDVLIIGGYYGSGRRGGGVAQFLVGLAERLTSDLHPRRFLSFCKVGTGLSDEELDVVITKLKPYFRQYEYPRKAPPAFYKVTDHSKERPDVWIESPDKSIILSITSDIRTIKSEVFEAPYSLRFPRIDKVRYDKPWHECLDVKTFVDLVHSSNGTTQKKGGEGVKQAPKVSKRGEKKSSSLVPSHLVQTDVSRVKEHSLIFSNMMFYFANVPSMHSLESLHRMVVENGGSFAMNINSSVTHCIAASSKGIKFEAAKLRGDVINCSWLLDCCAQIELLPLHPKYFLFISNNSKEKLKDEMDEYSDSYYWNLDLVGMRQLLDDLKSPQDFHGADDCRRKYCPAEKWCCFYGCLVYFTSFMSSLVPEAEILVNIKIRRLRLEVLMGGGDVSPNIEAATHIVVVNVPNSLEAESKVLLQSLTTTKKLVFQKNRQHLIDSQWLEDSSAKGERLPEHTYSLKRDELNLFEESEADMIKDTEEVGDSPTYRPEVALKPQRVKVPTRRPRLVKRLAKTSGNKLKDCSSEDKITQTIARLAEDDEAAMLSIQKNEEPNIPNKKGGDKEVKLEIIADPVHSMLIDMIPSLVATVDRRVEVPGPATSVDQQTNVDTEMLPFEKRKEAAIVEPQTSKKKKVSYKDLARELLKD